MYEKVSEERLRSFYWQFIPLVFMGSVVVGCFIGYWVAKIIIALLGL